MAGASYIYIKGGKVEWVHVHRLTIFLFVAIMGLIHVSLSRLYIQFGPCLRRCNSETASRFLLQKCRLDFGFVLEGAGDVVLRHLLYRAKHGFQPAIHVTDTDLP